MNLRLSTSTQSDTSYVSLLRSSVNSKSVSDVGDSPNNSFDTSQPSSTDEIAHTNAIKRMRSKSGDKKNDTSEITESLRSSNIVVDEWTDGVEVEPEQINPEYSRYSDSFRNKVSHFFVLSQSGKPIFSRYGNDNQTAAFIGVMQAMVSYVGISDDDSLKVMKAGEYTFVFIVKTHMILVAVSKANLVPQQLRIILSHLYSQILSILTYRTINRLYQRQAGVDLRRLLVGTDRYLLGMIDYMETELSPFLNSVNCVPMQYTLRQALLNTISQAIKINIKHLINDLVFCILLLDEKLVGVVRRKDQQLHPMDLQLLMNLIRNSTYFKTQICWLPMCLPKFDADGFLYAHISYLNSTRLSLVQLTVNPDQFDVLQQCRDSILDSMETQGLLDKLNHTYTVSEMLDYYKLDGQVFNFIYKMRNANQCVCYNYETSQPIVDIINSNTPTNDQTLSNPIVNMSSLELESNGFLNSNRLFQSYLRMHHLIHLPERPARLIYECYEKQTVIAWQTLNFELYANIQPVNSKRKIMETLNKLLDAINKQKSRLFVLMSPTF